ncbi:Alpha/Beta hydrolase protein [Xylariaceae sp. FL0594]|nr:Alpha/Beta hydrolase protein [Xylariaceae sp. FL0594]
MASLWAKQPLKGLFIAFHVLRTLVILSWVLIRCAPKSARPFPEWSLRQCVINVLLRQIFAYHTTTRSNKMAAVQADHKKARERCAIARPAADVKDLYSGVLASDFVRPAAVAGLWYPYPPPPRSTGVTAREKVVVHFPGGAFVLAFGSEMYGETVSAAMKKYLNVDRTFFAQYRLSESDETRFPAALQDVLTFYNYILSLGYRPENVVLSGDSAAGNLVIGLLRHLERNRSNKQCQLPLPGSVMLWSPWVHVTTRAGADYKKCRDWQTDCLIPEILQWGAEAYYPSLKSTTDEEEVAYISPLHRPFKTSVPVFVHAGATEALHDSIAEFAREMADVQGNRVRLHETGLTTHNLIMAYRGQGLDRQVERALADFAEFVGW